MRNLLVTGGAGFIGANFVHYWLDRQPEDNVVVLDVLTYAGNPMNLEALAGNPQFMFVEGDICDQKLVDDLMQKYKIDTLVHFAAESHVDRSITGPDAFVQTNVIGTHTLLKAAKTAWLDNESWDRACRFHHVSTDEVFGTLSESDPAFTELTPYAPNSPYSASKAGSDHLVRAYRETYSLPITISNCSNNYGPYQFPEKLIPVVFMNALAGKPLPIYGDGKNVRDWLYVHDHCEAIGLILDQGSEGETYNVGGLSELTNLDLVTNLCRVLDEMVPDSKHGPHEQLITFVKDRPGHDRRYAIDITKIESELNWRPSESLQSGLRKTIAWYLQNQQWIDSCKIDVSERRGLWHTTTPTREA